MKVWEKHRTLKMDTTKIKGRVPPFTGFFWHPSFNLIFQYITIHAWKTNQFVCPFWNISGRSWCSDGSCEPSGISSFEGGKQKSAERKQSNPEMQRAIEHAHCSLLVLFFYQLCCLCNKHSVQPVQRAQRCDKHSYANFWALHRLWICAKKVVK